MELRALRYFVEVVRQQSFTVAAEQMFAETSTSHAPWTVIGGNRKWNARMHVMHTVLKALGAKK